MDKSLIPCGYVVINMKQKRILAVIVACAVITAGLVACSANTSGGQVLTEAVTEVVTDADGQPVTEAVTDANGEVVTDANGEPVTEVVTEVVTDQNGEVVTQVVTDANGKPVTGTTTTTTAAPANNNSTGSGGTNSNNSPSKTPVTSASDDDREPESNEYIGIVLQKNGAADCSSSNVTVSSGKVQIDKPGDYLIKSTTKTWHGQIIVKLKKTEKAHIKFENVNIESESCNVLQFLDADVKSDRTFIEAETTSGTAADDQISDISESESAPNVSISFPEGTSSTFKSVAGGNTGIIYNESKLTVKGRGNCTLTCDIRKANNCICSTKSITIKNVNLNMTTAQHENTESLAKTSGSAKGIFSYSKVNVESGVININSNGDCIRCDSFYQIGGTMNIKSSACDAIDADDAIEVSGGSIKAVALSKYSFKVRRVDNSESARKGGVRSGKGDGFRINGGIVVGESKKISSLNSVYQSNKKGSSQASISCRIVKQNAGGSSAANEAKTPGVFSISGLNKESSNSCTKYLYSSSKVKKGTEYKVTANGNSANVTWSGNYGEARVISKTGK